MEPGPMPTSVPPAKRAGLPTWAIVLIVVGGVLFVVCVGGIAVVVPRLRESWRRLHCMDHQSRLGHIYLMAAQADGRRAQEHSGAALWLGYYGTAIRPGDEDVFVCPGDALAKPSETAEDRARYEHVDLAHAPRALCSYAGRDFERFPIDPKSEKKEVIGACVHHKGGAVVVYEAGDTMFLSLAELGVASDDEKTVGPDSKSPILRVLRYGDGSVR